MDKGKNERGGPFPTGEARWKIVDIESGKTLLEGRRSRMHSSDGDFLDNLNRLIRKKNAEIERGGSRQRKKKKATAAAKRPAKRPAAKSDVIPKGPCKECFRNASKWASDNDGPDVRVIHGTVISLKEGRRIDHAWVEVGNDVVDPTQGVRLPKERWYRITEAKVDADYSSVEALVYMARSGHQGPWTASETSHVVKPVPGEAPGPAAKRAAKKPAAKPTAKPEEGPVRTAEEFGADATQGEWQFRIAQTSMRGVYEVEGRRGGNWAVLSTGPRMTYSEAEASLLRLLERNLSDSPEEPRIFNPKVRAKYEKNRARRVAEKKAGDDRRAAEEKARLDEQARVQKINDEYAAAKPKFLRASVVSKGRDGKPNKDDDGKPITLVGVAYKGLLVSKTRTGYQLSHIDSSKHLGIIFSTQKEAKLAAWRLAEQMDFRVSTKKLDLERAAALSRALATQDGPANATAKLPQEKGPTAKRPTAKQVSAIAEALSGRRLSEADKKDLIKAGLVGKDGKVTQEGRQALKDVKDSIREWAGLDGDDFLKGLEENTVLFMGLDPRFFKDRVVSIARKLGKSLSHVLDPKVHQTRIAAAHIRATLTLGSSDDKSSGVFIGREGETVVDRVSGPELDAIMDAIDRGELSAQIEGYGAMEDGDWGVARFKLSGTIGDVDKGKGSRSMTGKILETRDFDQASTHAQLRRQRGHWLPSEVREDTDAKTKPGQERREMSLSRGAPKKTVVQRPWWESSPERYAADLERGREFGLLGRRSIRFVDHLLSGVFHAGIQRRLARNIGRRERGGRPRSQHLYVRFREWVSKQSRSGFIKDMTDAERKEIRQIMAKVAGAEAAIDEVLKKHSPDQQVRILEALWFYHQKLTGAPRSLVESMGDLKKLVRAVGEIRRAYDEVGRVLVRAGMLKEETVAKRSGAYLHRQRREVERSGRVEAFLENVGGGNFLSSPWGMNTMRGMTRKRTKTVEEHVREGGITDYRSSMQFLRNALGKSVWLRVATKLSQDKTLARRVLPKKFLSQIESVKGQAKRVQELELEAALARVFIREAFPGERNEAKRRRVMARTARTLRKVHARLEAEGIPIEGLPETYSRSQQLRALLGEDRNLDQGLVGRLSDADRQDLVDAKLLTSKGKEAWNLTTDGRAELMKLRKAERLQTKFRAAETAWWMTVRIEASGSKIPESEVPGVAPVSGPRVLGGKVGERVETAGDRYERIRQSLLRKGLRAKPWDDFHQNKEIEINQRIVQAREELDRLRGQQDWVKLDNDPRLGPLKEMYVHRSMLDSFTLPLQRAGWHQSLINIHAFVKKQKTARRPGTHLVNAVSNTIMAQHLGVNMASPSFANHTRMGIAALINYDKTGSFDLPTKGAAARLVWGVTQKQWDAARPHIEKMIESGFWDNSQFRVETDDYVSNLKDIDRRLEEARDPRRKGYSRKMIRIERALAAIDSKIVGSALYGKLITNLEKAYSVADPGQAIGIYLSLVTGKGSLHHHPLPPRAALQHVRDALDFSQTSLMTQDISNVVSFARIFYKLPQGVARGLSSPGAVEKMLSKVSPVERAPFLATYFGRIAAKIAPMIGIMEGMHSMAQDRWGLSEEDYERRRNKLGYATGMSGKIRGYFAIPVLWSDTPQWIDAAKFHPVIQVAIWGSGALSYIAEAARSEGPLDENVFMEDVIRQSVLLGPPSALWTGRGFFGQEQGRMETLFETGATWMVPGFWEAVARPVGQMLPDPVQEVAGIRKTRQTAWQQLWNVVGVRVRNVSYGEGYQGWLEQAKAEGAIGKKEIPIYFDLEDTPYSVSLERERALEAIERERQMGR